MSSELRNEIHNSLSNIVHKHEQSMVIKWIAIMETIEEDGQSALWMLSAEGSRQWDTIGMLTYALERERAAINKENASED